MTYAGLACLLLAGIIPRIHAQNFIEPVEEFAGVEYYEYNGERLAIFMQKVTWEQAHQLCPARNGTLADFESSGVAEFVARALAESAVGFGSLWIGGQLVHLTRGDDDEGVWQWVKTKTVIPSTLTDVKEFPMLVSPYWVDKPALKGKMCLGTDRRLHHLPLIVPVECDQKRPYICTLPSADTGTGGGQVKPPVEVGSKRYHLFYGDFTWAEALSKCLILGMQLAKLTTTEQFYVIGNRMRRARPIMENAWIGGKFSAGSWTWVSSNEAINVDKTNKTDKEPFAWYRPDDIINEGCLLADRHVCDHFAYVEAKCDRRRPYICEEDLKPDAPTEVLIHINGSNLWISTIIEIWPKAQNICKVCLGGELIHLKTTAAEAATQLPFLYQGMAIVPGIEIRHVWIGGYLFGKEFKWTDNAGKEITGAVPLTEKTFEGVHGTGDKGLLVYCKIDLTVDTFLISYKCLNMDRENQKNFFVYGLTCEMKQHFLCQAPDGAKLSETCKALAPPPTGPGVTDVSTIKPSSPDKEPASAAAAPAAETTVAAAAAPEAETTVAAAAAPEAETTVAPAAPP